MALKGYAKSQPTEPVELPGGDSFAVRGLSFVDMKALLVKYSGEIASIFDLMAHGKKGALDFESAAATAADFIQKFPAVAAEIIVIASGEEAAFEDALALPFPVQTDAVQKIVRMTFATEGSVKKFIQTISALIGQRQAASA
jgi:hypothetical protein